MKSIRNIPVKCLLNADEFLMLEKLSDDHGLSQSGLLRLLLKKEVLHASNDRTTPDLFKGLGVMQNRPTFYGRKQLQRQQQC